MNILNNSNRRAISVIAEENKFQMTFYNFSYILLLFLFIKINMSTSLTI